MKETSIYDAIGRDYATGRHTDPLIAARIHRYLAGADSILNVGAGTGSYEPDHPRVVAVEPSEIMIRQRRAAPHMTIRTCAENLPFDDKAFSHSMSVLSMHHWFDRHRALEEIARVTREKLVVVTWDPDAEPFWLTRNYFPGIYRIDKEIFPTISELAGIFDNLEVVDLPIPASCIDGFTGAFWRRPEAYLDAAIRARMSTFSKLSDTAEGLRRLQEDLRSGHWARRNRGLLEQDQLDIGYRIVVATISGHGSA